MRTLERGGLSIELNTSMNQSSKVRPRPLIEEDNHLIAQLQGKQGILGLHEAGTRLDQLPLSSLSRPHFPGNLSAIHSSPQSGSNTQRQSNKKGQKNRPQPISKAQIMAGLTPDEIQLQSEENQIRAQNLKKIKQYREQNKQSTIPNLLRTHIAQTRTIYPSFGQLVFWEIIFINPYNKRTRFEIVIDDPILSTPTDKYARGDPSIQPELQLVTNQQEWCYYKKIYGLNTPAVLNVYNSNSLPSTSMFDEKEQDEEKLYRKEVNREKGQYLILEANETVYIPFKFQSFCCGAIDTELAAQMKHLLAFPCPPNTQIKPHYQSLQHRIVQVNIENVDKQVLSFMRVDVRPQQFVVDKVVQYQHWSDEILKTDLTLPQPSNSTQSLLQPIHSLPTYIAPSQGLSLEGLNTAGNQQYNIFNDLTVQGNLQISMEEKIVKVTCSSNDVAFLFTQDENKATQISFKVRCDQFPATQIFYFAFYTDVYSACLHSIYQVNVNSHLRAELSAIVGQKTRGRIFLPSTAQRKQVRIVSSSAELLFPTNNSFILEENKVNQLEYDFRTAIGGKRSLLVYLIDTETHQLLQSWLLFINAVYPRVNNTFNIVLNVGQGSRKTFDYENPYKVPRTYTFESSQPDKLTLKEDCITIPPLGIRAIHLVINAATVPGSDVVFLFVNDEKGKNEECLQFNITYKV